MSNFNFDDETLLPFPLQDDSNLAMEEVIKAALNIDLTKFMTCLIDNLPESVLPVLGESMHIMGYEGWIDCKNSDEKGNLIKKSISLHRTKGTLFAIEKIFELSGIKAKYYHYKDYGGIPHHFKIVIDVLNQGWDDDFEYKILQKLREFKQLRAKLDVIEIYAASTTELKMNTAVIIGETVSIEFERQVA